MNQSESGRGRDRRAAGPTILVSRPLLTLSSDFQSESSSGRLRRPEAGRRIVNPMTELVASVRLGSSGRPSTRDDPRSESHGRTRSAQFV